MMELKQKVTKARVLNKDSRPLFFSLGQANTTSYKYTGREDDGSGLYYYRARYYHPRLQRFVAEDRLGFRGGDTNLYAYVHNNPVNLIDPLGDRSLTSHEKQFLSTFFGSSLNTTGIDIDVSIGSRAWSPYGDNIRLPAKYFKNGNLDCGVDLSNPLAASIFGHEATHVWQRQHGQWVTTQGLFLQIAYSLGINVYQYDASQTDPAIMLDNFLSGNIEQQGQIVQDFVYNSRTGGNTSPYIGVGSYLQNR